MTPARIDEVVAQYTKKFEFHEALIYSLQDLGLEILQDMSGYAQLPDEEKDLLRRITDNHAWITFFSSLVDETHTSVQDLYLQKAEEVFKTLIDLTQVVIDRYDQIDDKELKSYPVENLIGVQETYTAIYTKISLTIKEAKTIFIPREHIASSSIIGLLVIIAILGRKECNKFVDELNEIRRFLRIYQLLGKGPAPSKLVH